MSASPKWENCHDRALADVLEKEGGSVPAFLNAVFGFLSRQCPEELYNSSQISGEHLISQSYCKWRQKYLEEKTQKSLQLLQCTPECDVPLAVAEEEVAAEEPKHKINADPSPKTTAQNSVKENHPHSSFNAINGAIRESYAWTQSIEDLEVRICVHDSVRKGRQVKVKLQPTRMEVGVHGSSTSWQTLVMGDFPHGIKVEDSVWSLVPGDHILIHMEKAEERWWDRLLTNEDSIDLKKINAERDFATLPEEDQQRIQELVWNKKQQEIGKPTSDQMVSNCLLDKT
ncbi:nudC domain-containing protein 3-like isoform X1 [Penaeus japonicus]|uniref:nudC domain-containing protein 3-like isoform X1 n=1 Tax=Penaeus japonicus TaxID=27405 RepID=UPI001C714D18|nr:nudC domain-containing protein 3-like isoform X1 [Penaeus japonicus]